MTAGFLPGDGRGCTLAELAGVVGAADVDQPAIVARDIRHDSREVKPGDVFVARRGRQSDGLAFVEQAIGRGAVAVMAESGHAPVGLEVPVLRVSDVRVAMARASEHLHGHPTDKLSVFGITGTNGKTTTTHLVRSVLASAGYRPGVMGTLGTRFGEVVLASRFNTPEADELSRIASWMVDQGASHLLMETTSIALDQRRTDGVHFRAAAFTNLTRDHLDYHVTMEAYGRAKARLFLELGPEACAIMVDDAFGADLAERVGGPVVRVSRHAGARADVCPLREPILDASGIRCSVKTPSGPVELQSALMGEHNAANLLLALAVSMVLGVAPAAAAEALGASPGVEGRWERCDEAGDGIMVLVDYAHTPDGLENVLRALRPFARGRVICVFGCGGDRDRSKRPFMGKLAGQFADVAILTSDNPRSESPERIADAVLEGLAGGMAEVHVELDRGRAIELAVEQARDGDVVLLAGKGHETEQVVGSKVVHFDDREHARRALAVRRARCRS